jgi:hypothetical protein
VAEPPASPALALASGPAPAPPSGPALAPVETLVHANPALSAQSEWWVQIGAQAPPTHALPVGQLVAVQLALDFELLPQPAMPIPSPDPTATATMSETETGITTSRTGGPIVDKNARGRANRVTLDTSLPAFPKQGVAGGSQPFDMPQPWITVTYPRQNR